MTSAIVDRRDVMFGLVAADAALLSGVVATAADGEGLLAQS